MKLIELHNFRINEFTIHPSNSRKKPKIIKNKSKVQNNSNMLIQAEKNKGFRKQK